MTKLEKLAQVTMAMRHVARQRLIKKADLDSEIAKAKRIRDSSFIEDLVYNTLTGGLIGAGYGGVTGAGLGGFAGHVLNTRPSESTGVLPYDQAWIRGKGGIPTDVTFGKRTFTIKPESRADAHDQLMALGTANGIVEGGKKGLLYGAGGGAGIGALISLLTHGYRKEQARKKLKELGID